MGVIWILGAAIWGVAEATVFFIVPDVLITFAAVRFGFARVDAGTRDLGGRRGGGHRHVGWGAPDARAARAAMLMVPAIGADLLAKAHDGMAAADWPLHLFAASLTGTPYKLYAVEAGAQGIDPFLFVALSIPARLLRFLLTALLAAGGRVFMPWGTARWRYAVLGAAWVAVYVTTGRFEPWPDR